MTVIVYKDGWCFADDLLWDGNGSVAGRVKKLHWRKKDGAIIATSGPSAKGARFAAIAMKRATIPDNNGTDGENGCCGCIFMKDGVIREYDGAAFEEIGADFYTMGAGAEIANGALIVGADARQAAAAACVAKSWASGLHGVNHEGDWVYISPGEAFQLVHRKHVPE